MIESWWLRIKMSGPWTVSGLFFCCPICHRHKSKSNLSNVQVMSWAHKKYSGLENASLNHSLWLCPKSQTLSLSPPKEKPPAPSFFTHLNSNYFPYVKITSKNKIQHQSSTPQFAQSSTHRRVTLNNSLLPLKKTPHTGSDFQLSFQFKAHDQSIVARVSSRISILKALDDTNWSQQNKTMFITYTSLSDPFSWMQLPLISLTPHHSWFRNSKLSKILPFA